VADSRTNGGEPDKVYEQIIGKGKLDKEEPGRPRGKGPESK
jgi:hypothetical protein